MMEMSAFRSSAILAATALVVWSVGELDPDASVPTARPAAPRSTWLAPQQEALGAGCDFTELGARMVDGRPAEYHEFYFTRAIYSGSRGLRGFGRGGGAWATDYPKADYQFVVVVERLANLDAYDCHNAVRLDDPAIRNFPFLYALEVGYMRLSDAEIQGLRDYLAAGGFVVIDDFWGTWQWQNFEYEMSRALPGYEMVDLPLDHPLFTTFYEIDEVLQVPSINNGRSGNPAYYAEGDGTVPFVKGVFDDSGRLVMVVNGNTDLGDAWEWAENPYYPLDRSTFAYEMGVNMIVYSMSH